MADYQNISEAVISGNLDAVINKTKQALNGDNGVEEILDQGLLPPMDIVGERMKSGEMFIPEVLRAAKAMQAGMDLLRPLMEAADLKKFGVVVLGTVEGDLHDIGKNLVSMLLQGAGFEVHDLGTNVSAAQFVQAAKDHNANLVGMSALLTTTMPKMEETVVALEEAGLRAQVKILAGGAPVNQAFVDKIGADGYGANAAAAAEIAKELLAK